MKEREYILTLYEIYKNLLNEREIEYFENYYFEDYSLQEIADNFKVSKSYVGKFLNGIEDKLNNFEYPFFQPLVNKMLVKCCHGINYYHITTKI